MDVSATDEKSIAIDLFSLQVKPENILITSDGILKLCDFGIVHDLRSVWTIFPRKSSADQFMLFRHQL
jgi:serine/threonine protein kinase